MSGLCGIFSRNENNDILEYLQIGLYALQHRGQEGLGIVIFDDNRIYELKRSGMLSEVLTQDIINDIKGYAGLGLVKYLFSNNHKYEPMMPYIYDIECGKCTLVVDGTILNKDFNTAQLIRKINSDPETLIAYINTLQGVFNVLYLDKNKMVVIRDKHGVKPICIGKNDEMLVAVSEDCALEAMGIPFLKDVGRGEIFIQTKESATSYFCEQGDPHLCLFELIYIARPDSVIDGVSVYKARYEMGKRLFEECPTKADIVIGSPDSGLISAKGYAMASGIEYVDGILKNRYIQRTFIKPTQTERVSSVNIKLNAIRQNIAGKDVILVDDSIVRGTTITRIIKILKDAGANKVHIRIASPPVISSEKYTIDIPNPNKLIGYGKTLDQIQAEIGCDSLYYLSLNGLKDCCGNKGYYDKYFTDVPLFKEEE